MWCVQSRGASPNKFIKRAGVESFDTKAYLLRETFWMVVDRGVETSLLLSFEERVPFLDLFVDFVEGQYVQEHLFLLCSF